MYYIDHAIHATTNFILNTQIEDVDRFIRSSFDMLWYGFSEET